MVINKIIFKEAVKIKNSKDCTSAFSFGDITSRPVLNTPKHDIDTYSLTSCSKVSFHPNTDIRDFPHLNNHV
jgi:hypothetical protein